MDPDALAHALQEDAQKAGQSYEDYLAALDVIDEAEVAEILAKTDANGNPILNAAKRVSGLEASNLACVVLRFGGSGCNVRNHSFNPVSHKLSPSLHE